MTMSQTDQRARAHVDRAPMWKFFVFSAIGGFMFFAPIELGGERSIPLDHLVSAISGAVPALLPWYALALITAGAAHPLLTGQWRRSRVDLLFTVAKLVGLAVGTMLVLEVGPGWLFRDDIGPFLFDALVVPVGLLVPVGAVFLALLVGYGLLEFCGVLMQPVMRPLFRTPGRSAIDAVASFVGSYSLGLLITNRVYREGRYTGREAAVIATGFSTVSATFMVVVASTLDLMGSWLTYFWATLVVTFVVTAITVRIPPLSRIPDEVAPGVRARPEEAPESGRVAHAWNEACVVVAAAPPLWRNVRANLRDGVLMTMAILPSILSIGLLGLVLATFTPVFDWLGYVFAPFTWALQLPDPLLVGKALSVGVAEMFLPALLVTSAAPAVKFVVAVVAVSQVIFFSALVPCVVATDIPVSIPQLLLVWLERVVLSLLLVTPVAYLLF
jgi:nucleoside recognition membrane protein YjiH